MSSAPSLQGGEKSFVRKVLGAIGATVFIVAFTALLVESAYRFYLKENISAELVDWNSKFAQPDRPTFGVHGVPPWGYDRNVGHSYHEGLWRTATINAGAFGGCGVAGSGNRLGNYGWMPNDHLGADLRVMIVGSSFSMVQDEKGRMVDQVLMERLSTRLKRSVSVLNYSRDSTGVIANIKMARHRFDEAKPHVIIALINTIALIAQPHWRLVVQEDNGFRRLHFLLDADAKPGDPTLAVAQPFVINDRVTDEWCRTMTAVRDRADVNALRDDPLVRELVARHNKQQRETLEPKIAINFWRPDISFAWNLVTKGDPFDGMPIFAAPIYNALKLDRYTDYPNFRTTVNELKALGVPVILVHIPQLEDMRARSGGTVWELAANGLSPRQGGSLVADLEAAMGERFVHLYPYYTPTFKGDPLKMVVSEADSHPSQVGVGLMAEALERMLAEHPHTSSLLKRPD